MYRVFVNIGGWELVLHIFYSSIESDGLAHPRGSYRQDPQLQSTVCSADS